MLKQTDTWLEPLLTRELRRVAAPPELRPDRVREEPLFAPSMWFACASAAGLLLASAVGLHAYISNAAPLAGQGSVKAVRFQSWVRASTGLNVHAACRLCHADEELRAAIPQGSQRLLADAFFPDAGVY
ncbi:MAG: hypothetical protein ABI833_12585 [Acidobacteriota bacterium]